MLQFCCYSSVQNKGKQKNTMQGGVKWIEYSSVFLTMRNLKYAVAQAHFESSLEKKQASLSGVPRRVGKRWLRVGVGSLGSLGEERKGWKTSATLGVCCELAFEEALSQPFFLFLPKG